MLKLKRYFLFRKVLCIFALMKPKFDIIYTDEAENFILSLPSKARNKVAYNLTKSRYFMDNELFKKLENTDIWKFRTLYNGICYRLLAFWDTERQTLVVATHGFIKKTQKTPQKEISRAETIRREYFNEKSK